MLLGLFMGAFLIAQILLTLENLWDSIDRLSAERELRELEAFKAQTSSVRMSKRGHAEQSVPRNDAASILTKAQVEYTKEYIEKSRRKMSLIHFPSYLDEHVYYDLSAKQALIDLQQWLFEHKYTVPLFQDRFKSAPVAKGPKICVAITTAYRAHAPFTYLLQTISALLNRMNYAKYKDSVYIHVFNVDPEPKEYVEAQIASYFLPVTNLQEEMKSQAKFGVELMGFPLPRKYQENLDNAQVFRRMNSLNCQYPIFIEDDALAKNDWMDSVEQAIRQMEEYEQKRTTPDWFMLKLYCARESYLAETPPEGVNITYFQRWNTVAMMINRDYVLQISDHLERKVRGALAEFNLTKPIAKDEDIDDWRNSTGLAGMCYEPVVFQHTGVFSSVETRHPDKKSVERWYMKSQYFTDKGKPVIFDKSHWEPLLR